MLKNVNIYFFSIRSLDRYKDAKCLYRLIILNYIPFLQLNFFRFCHFKESLKWCK